MKLKNVDLKILFWPVVVVVFGILLYFLTPRLVEFAFAVYNRICFIQGSKSIGRLIAKKIKNPTRCNSNTGNNCCNMRTCFIGVSGCKHIIV